jgi:tetratricopeptide (TPR) repeat protein
MNFTLAREQGPPPGSLDRLVLQQVSTANALRDKGQFEQALSAYQIIRQQNPKLTSLNMVIAGVYRRQAEAEANPAARRALLERAIDTYGQLLTDETNAERARAEIASTRAEVEALPR